MLEIDKAFNTTGSSVYEFFQRPGIGFYIPLYQRDYSWDRDNIDQLLDDIGRGVARLTEPEYEEEIRFLGTIISVTEKNPNNIEPVDKRGLPPTIEKIIDGQQRLSTICLFATQLFEVISNIEGKIDTNSEYKEEIEEVCKSWKDKLIDVFSLDLKRGKPQRKPKIIRGHSDKWIKDGNIEEAYSSDLSNYLAKFIAYVNEEKEYPKPDRRTNVGRNTKAIFDWLRNEVAKAHVKEEDDLVPAWVILEEVNEKDLWQYERPKLKNLIQEKKDEGKDVDDKYYLCSLLQIFAVTHYLLERCCFTHIQPLNDDWAFDMFQSLNASGTPLTSIETFKPLVVNTARKEFEGSFKGSSFDINFTKVEELFKELNTAAQKSKRTNEFLTSLRIIVDGGKLPSHFSYQRKWLDSVFTGLEHEDKKRYIKFLGNYAEFYKNVWLDYKGEDNNPLDNIASNKESELASVLLLYLKKNNHKMAATILGAFYSRVLEGEEHSIKDFVEAIKSVAAFYTMWRAARGNSGLDNIYRTYFKGESEKDVKVQKHNWLAGNRYDVEVLKDYLKEVLQKENIWEKDDWVKRTSEHLKYKSKGISKFILLLTSHNTIPDVANPGLMKVSKSGVVNYLNLKRWSGRSVENIEHIAPQTNTNAWDVELYSDEDLIHRIGNLTLLPTTVNSSVSNKGWKEKLIYYRHLSEKDPDKISELSKRAKTEGIELNEDTIKILQDAEYNDHIGSIVTVSEDHNWGANLVKKRTERILEISWDRLSLWLQSDVSK